MPETLAALPAVWLLGAGLVLGCLAFLVSTGQRLRLPGLPLPLFATLLGLGIGGALWLVAPLVTPLVAETRAAPRNCAEARALGFGNARRGEVGYFAHLDADRDGISCEPMPRR